MRNPKNPHVTLLQYENLHIVSAVWSH